MTGLFPFKELLNAHGARQKTPHQHDSTHYCMPLPVPKSAPTEPGVLSTGGNDNATIS